jgi:hypothetical protein
LGKEGLNVTYMLIATHVTVRSLSRRVGHKLYMQNFFPSSDLFNDLHAVDVNSCGTVKIIKEYHRGYDSKSLKLK